MVASVSLYIKDGNVWMNQSQLAALFDTSIPNISMHISNILKEKELQSNSVIKNYLTTASDGKEFNDKEVLKGLGSISNKQMENKVRKIYEQFDASRKLSEAQKEDAIELEEIEKLLKKKK